MRLLPLNHLFDRHQVSLMRAALATSAEARRAHQALADGYARRIMALRDGLGGVPVPCRVS